MSPHCGRPPRRSALHLLWCAAVLLLAACPAGAGGNCQSSESCPDGFHCAQVEICTRRCANDSQCLVKCGEGCGVLERCTTDGFCEESTTLQCVRGYCQKPCAHSGDCGYDAYGPTSRHREQDNFR